MYKPQAHPLVSAVGSLTFLASSAKPEPSFRNGYERRSQLGSSGARNSSRCGRTRSAATPSSTETRSASAPRFAAKSCLWRVATTARLPRADGNQNFIFAILLHHNGQGRPSREEANRRQK